MNAGVETVTIHEAIPTKVEEGKAQENTDLSKQLFSFNFIYLCIYFNTLLRLCM